MEIDRSPTLVHLRRGKHRAVLAATLVCYLVGAWGERVSAQAQGCSRADFEQVVDTAAMAIAELNGGRTPTFQARLRELKAKRGWTHAQFIELGTPFVQDPQIAEFDAVSSELLAKITDQGEQGAAASVPDCKLLAELRGTMQALIETQGRKWEYMFSKLERALKE